MSTMCSPHASCRLRPLLPLQLSAILFLSSLQADLDPRLVGQWPGHWRGWSRAVAVTKNYAFVGADDLLVVDIADPVQPRLIGNYMTDREILDVTIQGELAYVTCRAVGSHAYSDLQIVNVGNPASPEPLGRLEIDLDLFGGGLRVSGYHAFVATTTGLEIIDCTDPRRPTKIGKFTAASSARDVEIRSGYGYLATHDQGLMVLDLSDLANPQLLGSAPGGSLKAVSLSGDYALVTGGPINNTDKPSGLQVFDVSDPRTPRWVASADTSGFPYNLAVSGNHAYVADLSGGVGEGLVVFDISTPTAPQRIGRYDMKQTGGAFDVALAGSLAFVAGNGLAGLALVDIQSPDDPQLLGGYQTWGEADDVAIDWPLIYVADHTVGLQIIDASDPSKPRRVGRYADVAIARSVDVDGHYAYLTDGSRGLQIINVSDPAHPVRAARFDTEDYAEQVRVRNHHAYVSIGKGVQIVDVSNPDSPRHVATITTLDDVKGLALGARHVYIAEGARLQIVDVADPARPHTAGHYSTEADLFGVAELGRYLCLLDSLELHMLDVSDPTNPTRVGGCQYLGSKEAVTAFGNLVYVVSWVDAGLQIFDVSNPQQPRPLASCRTGGRPFGVSVAGDYVCVADGQAGLKIFHVTNPANPERRTAFPTEGKAVAVSTAHDYVYLAGLYDGLYVFDITDPANPVPTGWCQDHLRWLTSYLLAFDLAVANGRVCIVGGSHPGLELFDVTNPAAPASVATFYTYGGTEGVALAPSGDYAYVALGSAGLDILDISVPSDIKRLANLPLVGDAIRVAATSTHAYVAAGEAGLHIVDITDPALPLQVASDSSGPALGVAIRERYAYVAEWNVRSHFDDDHQGLRVVDIADPALPRPLRYQSPLVVTVGNTPPRPLSLQTSDADRQPRDLAVVGDHVYLTTGSSGLLVFDVRDPANPRRVGGNRTLRSFGVAANHSGAFVAAGDEGLVLLNPYHPIPQLEPWARFDSTGFRVPFRLDAGGSVRLQRSSDLLTWEDWVILPTTGDVQEVTDPNPSGQPRQFYRAVAP